MKKILLATTNKNKVKRILNLIDNSKYKVLSLTDLKYQIPEPEETGQSPERIAENKALYYYQNIFEKIPVLTQDDTI